MWCDFTNDKAKIEAAVQQVTPGVAAQLADNSYAPAQNGEYDIVEDNEAAFTADSTEFNVFNTDQKLEAVEGLSNVLSAIPGRKAVIQFTGGITQTGEENRTELRAATDAANRADVSIYEIDARGLYADIPGGAVSSAGASGTSMYTGAAVFKQTDARMDSRDTLGTLSTDTGGRSFFDLGDLSEAFPKIEEENTGYYLLGYYLEANVKHDGSWHALRVKVNAPGTHIRSRDGYYAPRDFQHLEKKGSRASNLNDAMNSASGRRAADRRRDGDVPPERPPGLRPHFRQTFFQRARLGAKARREPGGIRFRGGGSRHAVRDVRGRIARYD